MKEIKKPKISLLDDFSSQRLPYFEPELYFECEKILFDLKIRQFPFLINSFSIPGNNINGDFNQFLYKIYNITSVQERTKILDISLGLLEIFFQSEELKKNYEGVFNTLNFIKNSIYKKLQTHYGGNLNSKNLLWEFNQNKSYLDSKLPIEDICTYLKLIKQKVPLSRSSVSDHSITSKFDKHDLTITRAQEQLLDAVAFGSTFNELTEENYTISKRLIYVPNHTKK